MVLRDPLGEVEVNGTRHAFGPMTEAYVAGRFGESSLFAGDGMRRADRRSAAVGDVARAQELRRRRDAALRPAASEPGPAYARENR